MTPTDENAVAYLEKRALALLLVGVTIALGWILLPFYGTILWAAIIALLFTPLYRLLLPRVNFRPNPAALLSLLAVIVIVIVPFALITASLAREVGLVVARLQAGELNPALYLRGVFDALPEWLTSLVHRLGFADFDALQRKVVTTLVQAGQFIATQAFNIGQNTFEFVADLFITLYLAFFLIRDGDSVMRSIRRAIPLNSAHQQELLDKFGTVIGATVKGNLLVAAIQGALGGFAFFFLGVGGALLWAVLMAFLSLLPAVGAGLVWLPVAVYFFLSGAIWQGVALIAWGVLVIGLVDNLLRPILVGKGTRMPDYLVMITTLGGMAVFGINGFVVGPAIAAMFIAVWHIFLTSRDAGAGLVGESPSD
jgi:predicted PurR-regulated permease PerM